MISEFDYKHEEDETLVHYSTAKDSTVQTDNALVALRLIYSKNPVLDTVLVVESHNKERALQVIKKEILLWGVDTTSWHASIAAALIFGGIPHYIEHFDDTVYDDEELDDYIACEYVASGIPVYGYIVFGQAPNA